MAVDRLDFIVNKGGTKKYRTTCDTCKADRGYIQHVSEKAKRPTPKECVRCKNSVSLVENKPLFCSFCNEEHCTPTIGNSNDYWLWERREDMNHGGHWRCKKYLKHKALRWDIGNPDRARAKNNKASRKRRSTIRGKLRSNISARMSTLIKQRTNTASNRNNKFKGLCWTIDELLNHLEANFQPSMTWDNYSKDGWHVDHIVPDSWFEYNSEEDGGFAASWALSNLQPLWAKDNLSKGNRRAG